MFHDAKYMNTESIQKLQKHIKRTFWQDVIYHPKEQALKYARIRVKSHTCKERD